MNKSGTPFRPPAQYGWVTPYPTVETPFKFFNELITGYSQSNVTYDNVLQPDGTSTGSWYSRVVQTDACGDVPYCGTSSGCPAKPWWGAAYDQYNGENLPPTGSISYTIVSQSACSQGYYKNVQAKKYWHGTTGFLDEGGCYDNYCQLPNNEGLNAWKSFQGSCVGVKYCSVTWTGDYSYTEDIYTITGESGSQSYEYYSTTAEFAEWDRSVSVDYSSGKWTQTYAGTSGSNTWVSGSDPVSSSVSSSLSSVYTDTHLAPFCTADSNTVTIALAEWSDPITLPDDTTNGFELHLTRGGNGYTINDTWVDLPDSTLDIVVTRANDEYIASVAVVNYHDLGGGTQIISISGTSTVTLGSEVDSATLQTTLDNLLSHWDMTDDKQYPWRSDGYCGIAPLVCLNEQEGSINPFSVTALSSTDYFSPLNDEYDNEPYTEGWTPTYDIIEAFDESAYQWQWAEGQDASTAPASALILVVDGQIIGKPGHAGNFDLFFKNYMYSPCTIGGSSIWWVNSIGEFNTGQYGIPLSATHWTNKYEASMTMLGAFTYNSLDGSVIRQKWAEKKLPFHSWDFNKPYGNDKFSIDEPAFGCNVSGDTSSVTFDCYDYIPQVDEIWGGVFTDGYYPITSVSNSGSTYTVSLGTKFSFVPSYVIDDFYKLRFPTASAVGLEQFSAVYVAASSSTYLTFGTELVNVSGSCKVDLYDGSINELKQFTPDTLIVSNVDLYKNSPTEYYVSGNYTNSSFICGVGKLPKWYDNNQKGQIVTLEWQHDYRTNAETSRLVDVLDCDGNPVYTGSANNGYASFTARQVSAPTSSVNGLQIGSLGCVTDVVCYSNNGETFNSTSKTYAIPQISLDYDYTALWQSQVLQSVYAFDWQLPHKPCNKSDYFASIDDGTCLPDDDGAKVYYYPIPYQIEPFIDLPTGAPDPTGSGYPAWRMESPVTSTSSLVIYPGGPIGYAEYYMPWIMKLYICANEPSSSCGMQYSWMIC